MFSRLAVITPFLANVGINFWYNSFCLQIYADVGFAFILDLWVHGKDGAFT